MKGQDVQRNRQAENPFHKYKPCVTVHLKLEGMMCVPAEVAKNIKTAMVQDWAKKICRKGIEKLSL